MSQGTPKTLNQAILNGSNEKDFPGGPNMAMRAHVADFLGQKFTKAYLKANDEQIKALKELWEAIYAE